MMKRKNLRVVRTAACGKGDLQKRFGYLKKRSSYLKKRSSFLMPPVRQKATTVSPG